MSVYKVIEIIGTSTESWEDAGLTAVKKARETIRNLRVAEVLEQDLDLDDSGGATFRTKLRVFQVRRRDVNASVPRTDVTALLVGRPPTCTNARLGDDHRLRTRAAESLVRNATVARTYSLPHHAPCTSRSGSPARRAARCLR